MNNFEQFAQREFRAAGWTDENGKFKDAMQQMVCEHVMKLLQVFDDEGHSGSSAPYALGVFKKLAMFEPLVPLTGEDWEWTEVCDGVFQNKRCSHVFKQADRFNGQAYDINAIVFYDWHTSEETGEKYKSHYTSRDSQQPITFPYTPKSEYKESPAS